MADDLDDIALLLRRMVGAEAVEPPQINQDLGSYIIRFRIPKEKLGRWNTAGMDALENAQGEVLQRVDISKNYYKKNGQRVQNWRLIFRFVPKTELEAVAVEIFRKWQELTQRYVDLPPDTETTIPLHALPAHRFREEPSRPGADSTQVNGWGAGARRA